MKRKSGFTLIELLLVVGVLGVILTVTVLLINPIEFLKQSRDATRISDLRATNDALNLVQVYNPSALGVPDNIIYVSLPSATSPNCDPSLPTPPGGWSYNCETQADYRKVNSSGWIPVDFTSIPNGSPLSVLPVDPTNTPADGLYYTFVKGSWELNARMESLAYNDGGAKNAAGNDGGDTDLLYEIGTKFTNVPTIINDRLNSGATTGIVPDSTSTYKSNSTTGLTWLHTVGSDSNRLLLVGISFWSNPEKIVNSVTYNGVSLVKSGSVWGGSGGETVNIWYLVNPPTGTFNIIASFSGAVAPVGGATSWSGVNQTTPLGAFASAFSATTTNPATVNIPSAVGEIVQDTVSYGKQTTTDHTVGSGQTQKWSDATSDGSLYASGAGSVEPGASTTTMSWTFGIVYRWAIGAVSIKPAP